MNNIEYLIKTKRWSQIVESYSPNFLSKHLSFKEGLLLSRKLLENESWDVDLQKFAVVLIEEIKKFYSQEWKSNWKHEAYRGYAYDVLGYEYEKVFEAYQKAADSASSPTPEVLMRLAMSWNCPGIYPKMTKEKATEILEDVAKKVPYMQAASCLVRLYREANQMEKAEYWKKVFKESEKKNLYDRRPYLDFFEEYGW